MDQKQIEIPSEIRQFLESILQEANLQMPDENVKEQVLQELFFQLDNYLASVITDNLSAEDLEVFIKMNEEKKSKEEIEAFIKDKLPNAQELFTNAFGTFRDLYLKHVDAAREKQAQA